MEELTEPRALRFFNGQGRLTVVPAKPDRKVELLEYLITYFDAERIYTEKEVNEVLLGIYDDFPYLRRLLIEHQLLMRDPAGHNYQVVYREVQ